MNRGARRHGSAKGYFSAPVVGPAPGLAVSVTVGTGGALPGIWTSLGTITPRLTARVSGCWTSEG